MQTSRRIYQSLFWRMAAAFLLLVLLIGASYITLTVFFSQQYFSEAQQQLHADLAQQLIDEKFQSDQPFLPDGAVNKALFGDLMHDMMAVNRSIEVYLLAPDGQVLYSVVLDEQRMAEGEFYVDLKPIRQFIAKENEEFILGDDPLVPGESRIFSAAPFNVDGREGYIYIILAGQEWQTLAEGLLGSYTLRVGAIALGLAMLFALVVGFLLLAYLTRRLQKLIGVMRRFEDGDMLARVELKGEGEIAQLGRQFNLMAEAIWGNFEAIKSTEKLRQDLIANVSHDLRTPLAVIHGYAETLQLKGDQLPPEESNRYIKVILRNATKLKKLVAELFELSKLEAKQVKAKPEAIAIDQLLADMKEQYRMMAKEKGIELALATDGQPSQRVWADLALIERVCQNLLDNAIKFTPAGGQIKLSLKAAEQEGWVAVEVADTGTGIPPEELPFIFDRYATKSRTKSSQSGTGLGLAIAKKIMDLHQSTLEVRSQLKQGTCFTFQLKTV
ncbi:MAG: ATP-binding protein [Bacteroidota bacterium]